MKEYKKMIGSTIYELRKNKGLSQSELGNLVGVSNKAVSKWETDEANPEISLLPKLASVLDVTIDELLGVTPNTTKDNYKEGKVLGFKGKIYSNDKKYEFISDKKTKKQTPYLHINIGKKLETLNAKSRGIIAIGNNAKGILSIGLISIGILSIGLLSLGILAIGIFALGILALASFSLGIVAVGAIACGVIAIGAIAIGYISIGGISVGYYAYTSKDGLAIGEHIKIFKK